jgi:hypothetical protein
MNLLQNIQKKLKLVENLSDLQAATVTKLRPNGVNYRTLLRIKNGYVNSINMSTYESIDTALKAKKIA